MKIKNVLAKKGIQPRDLGHVGAENANEVMHESASIDDRVVSNADPDESLPKPVKKEPIISVNGEDVDRDRAA